MLLHSGMELTNDASAASGGVGGEVIIGGRNGKGGSCGKKNKMRLAYREGTEF